MASEITDENPLAVAQQDEKIVRLVRKSKLEKFTTDDTIIDEIKQYVIFGQSNRKNFEPNDAEDLRQLIKEMEKTQSYRDRVTTIRINSTCIINDLDILIKSGTAYLHMQYSQEMKACSNQQTREAAIRFVLDPIIRRRDQWKGILEVAELAKDNLNETYFALREIGENGRKILDARNIKKSF